MLPTGKETTIVEALRAGQYSLLLGAGFSATSLGPDGSRLPTSDAFAAELAAAEKLPLYPLAQLTLALPPDKLASHLVRRFKGCQASPGVKSLSHFVWQHVFTFNVDDVVEDCYSTSESQQTLKPATFAENYFRPADLRDLPLVFLHGSVHKPAHGFVFSAEQYGTSIAQDSRWFKIFADIVTSSPLIVVGCSLNEPDVFYHLQRRNGIDSTLSPIPSLYVSRDVDPVKEALCAKFGLLPVVASADDFFTALRSAAGKLPGPLDLVRPAKTDVFAAAPSAADQRIFFRQWLLVEPGALPKLAASTEPEPNLLIGVEPQWAQIERGDDVSRAVIDKLLADAIAWKNGTAGPTLKLVESQAGEGKTSVLMRVSIELAKLGVKIFFYNTFERISVRETEAAVIGIGQPTVLVIDRLGEHGTQVAELLEFFKSKAVRCLIVAADRQQRHRRIADVIAPEDIEEVSLPLLTRTEGESLLVKMRKNGLLGAHSGRKDTALLPLIVGKELFTSIVQLNSGAKQLPAVVASELGELSPAATRLYAVAALAHHCGYPLKSAVLIRASGVPVSEAFQIIYGGQLKGLVRRLPPMGEYYETRHRVVATEVVRQLDKDDVLKVAIDLANALAPYVNTKTYSRGTEEARLAARLMDYDSVLEELIGSGRAGAFYREVKDAWDWNNRYWTQMALLKLNDEPGLALQYAETAVGIERHFVALTTLAKVLFKLARISANSSAGADYLHRALKISEDALNQGASVKRANLQTLDVAIRGTIMFFEASGAGRPDSFVSERMDDFLHEARGLFIAQEQRKLARRWAELLSPSARSRPPPRAPHKKRHK